MATLTEKRRATRNLNPHAEAIYAMHAWSYDYAFKQKGGSMDFWDNLPEQHKRIAREAVAKIRAAKTEEVELLVKA